MSWTEEEKRRHRCCFTGHRPEKLRLSEREVCAALEREIHNAITDGFHVFISGMARGTDIWAAEIVLAMKKKYPDKNINLIAAIPYEGQTNKWSEDWKKRYADILNQADEKVLLQKQYTRGCLHARNRYMVDNSSFIIAVFNGEEGGTKYTIDYAKKQGLRIKILDPREYA